MPLLSQLVIFASAELSDSFAHHKSGEFLFIPRYSSNVISSKKPSQSLIDGIYSFYISSLLWTGDTYDNIPDSYAERTKKPFLDKK